MKNNKKTALTGGHAVGEAIRQINPDVMAVYPITPQTPIIEYFAKKVADGEADTEIIPVESEHSAMSACIGSCAAGSRTVTASSSQGIMYMMEVLPIASSMRLPIVMAVANRAISGPINIHCDHSDAMAMREHGWIQVFSENAQEAYDNTIVAMKLAEEAKLPVAVNLDGFFTSHSVENISLVPDNLVKNFVGNYVAKDSLFDFKNPKTFGPLALQNSYFEFRKEIWDAMGESKEIFSGVAGKFNGLLKKEGIDDNVSAVESYKINGAEKVIVAMGSTCGTAKEAVDKLRSEGQKVGLLKIRLFRPFPFEEVAIALKKAKQIIVLDRNLVFGSKQVLAGEIEHVLGKSQEVKSVVYGLGGRDIFQNQIEQLLKKKLKNFEFLA